MPTIQYQLTHNEVVGTAFRRRMARPSVWVFMGTLAVVALALALMGRPAIDAAPYFLGIAAVFPFAMYFGLSTAISRAPWLTAPTTLEFDDAGVRMKMGDLGQEMPWRIFLRWSRSPEHLFLYPGRGPNALTVPVHAFDGTTLEEFVRYLERMGPAT